MSPLTRLSEVRKNNDRMDRLAQYREVSWREAFSGLQLVVNMGGNVFQTLTPRVMWFDGSLEGEIQYTLPEDLNRDVSPSQALKLWLASRFPAEQAAGKFYV